MLLRWLRLRLSRVVPSRRARADKPAVTYRRWTTQSRRSDTRTWCAGRPARPHRTRTLNLVSCGGVRVSACGVGVDKKERLSLSLVDDTVHARRGWRSDMDGTAGRSCCRRTPHLRGQDACTPHACLTLTGLSLAQSLAPSLLPCGAGSVKLHGR
jgi:hypothetical protein